MTRLFCGIIYYFSSFYSVTRPNHVRIIPYGVFGVSKLTITAISVESSVAIMQALKPSEIARIPLSIRKYSRIPLTIPATAPYSFARFQKSPSRTTWKKTTGATSYNVYKVVGKKWVKVATVKGTSYTFKGLKKNTTYKFAVKAYKSGVAAASYPTVSARTAK